MKGFYLLGCILLYKFHSTSGATYSKSSIQASSPYNCPLGCSKRGKCDATSRSCICESGFTGYGCSQRLCPTGIAWTDIPSSANVAHADGTECSNMGHCDRRTGKCQCRPGFSGRACDRINCPLGEFAFIIRLLLMIRAIMNIM